MGMEGDGDDWLAWVWSGVAGYTVCPRNACLPTTTPSWEQLSLVPRLSILCIGLDLFPFHVVLRTVGMPLELGKKVSVKLDFK